MRVATLFALLLPALLQAQSVQIATWRHNAKAAYSIIMDDYGEVRFGDIAFIDSTLANRNLRVSFAMIADDDISEPWWPECDGACKEASWEQARKWHAAGHEFVNHSWNHAGGDWRSKDFALQIDSSQARIERNIPGNRSRFFVFPGGVTAKDDDIAYLRTRGYIGVRHGRGNSGIAGVNQATMNDPFHTGSQFFATGRSAGGIEEFNRRVEEAIRIEGWAVNNTHNIGRDTGWMPMPAGAWIQHIDRVAEHVANNALWVAPVQEVIMYLMERQHFRVALASTAEDTLLLRFDTERTEINPSPLVDNTSYDYPLTLLLTLPPSLRHKPLMIRQGDSPLTYDAYGDNRIAFDAMPHGGEVTVCHESEAAAGVRPPLPPMQLSVEKRYGQNALLIRVPHIGSHTLRLHTLSGRLVAYFRGCGESTYRIPLGGGMMIAVLETTDGTTMRQLLLP